MKEVMNTFRGTDDLKKRFQQKRISYEIWQLFQPMDRLCEPDSIYHVIVSLHICPVIYKITPHSDDAFSFASVYIYTCLSIYLHTWF